MIAHEKGFKFHAQPQTGAYSCLDLVITTINGLNKIPEHIIEFNILPHLGLKEDFNVVVYRPVFV